jgi:hypothetical protein
VPVLAAGTITALRSYRARYDRLLGVARELTDLGYVGALSGEVMRDLAELEYTMFGIQVPCLVCKVPVLVDVRVGDPERPEPNAVICGPCASGWPQQEGGGTVTRRSPPEPEAARKS